MTKIIPIKELKNTSEISDMCHRTKGPVYVTKNGYGDLVIMSMENYEAAMRRLESYARLKNTHPADTGSGIHHSFRILMRGRRTASRIMAVPTVRMVWLRQTGLFFLLSMLKIIRGRISWIPVMSITPSRNICPAIFLRS